MADYRERLKKFPPIYMWKIGYALEVNSDTFLKSCLNPAF